MRAAAVLLLLVGGCGGWATQVKGDLEAVMPECTTEAAITACQCAARVLRDRQCKRIPGSGLSLPPACREHPASQAVRP
jgi:hypothetical protein